LVNTSGNVLQDRAIRLFTFLRELAKLKTKVTKDLDQYDNVVWFSAVPNYKGCFSVLAPETDRLQDTIWLEIKKTPEPKVPSPPASCLKWLASNDEDDITVEPQLRDEIPIESTEGYPYDQDSQELNQLSETEKLSDYPEITNEWETWKRDGWLPWVETYKQWKQADNIYFRLFSIYQQMKKLGERYEIVLGLGLLTWETPNNQLLRRHVIVGNANLSFDADRAKFEVQGAPDGVKLQFETEMIEQSLLPSLEQQKELESILNLVQESPWEKDEIDKILRSFVNSLSPEGVYSDSSQAPTKPVKEPTITFAPAVILRQRTQKSQVQCLSNIIDQIDSGGDIPTGIGILCEESNEIEDGNESGESNQSNLADSHLYLPLPTNDEQRQIISRITNQHGVLVQGPPGTGKSHTIANLICHLLAQGKRVLVTSQTPRALKVLKAKIPEEMRTLCVTLLGNDQAARQELEDSVSGINQRYSDWDSLKSKRRIIELDEYLYKIKKEKADKERLLREIREIDTQQYSVADGKYKGTAQQIAKSVARAESQHSWLAETVEYDESCPLSNIELKELIRLFRELSEEYCAELKSELITRDAIPEVAEFVKLVDDEAKAKQGMTEYDSRRSSSRYQALRSLTDTGLEDLRKSLADLIAAKSSIKGRFAWIQQAASEVLAGNDTAWEGLYTFLTGHLNGLEKQAIIVQTLDIRYPEYIDRKKLLADARELQEHVDTGGKMGWGMLAPKVARQNRYITKEVKINGRLCKTSEQIKSLINYLDVVDKIELSWSAFQGKDKREEGSFVVQVGYLKERMETLEEVLNLEKYLHSVENCLKPVSGIGKPRWDNNEELDEILRDIQAIESERVFEKVNSRIEDAIQRVRIIQSSPRSHGLNQEILAALEVRDPQKLAKCAEKLELLEKGREAVNKRDALCNQLSKSAPKLALQIQKTFADNVWDERADIFETAWAWRVADNWLKKFSKEHDEIALESSLRKLVEEERKTTASLAASKAWDNCLRHLTPFQRQNLVAWANAVKKMPKTPSAKTRPRWLREAQTAMDNCRGAIPAWIMPLYRVFETITPSPECFDVVIIDEASQTGPEGMVLQYLAKQCIVVGDNQQISPDAIGVVQEEIDTLIKRYLDDIPFKGHYVPQNSIFDFASILFKSKIVLREHFRCMPEIIQFSNQLCYTGTPLKPLRQYPPKRLEPIVVRHVQDGFREGSSSSALNRPEADALVDAMVEMCSSKEYEGKTMGVISLQGEAQAKYIENKLLTSLSPTELESRKVVCGDAYAFQGDERDIIFLSMVAAPNERIGALVREADKRRFNVAASRAKDQLFLFHTATLNDLNPECMRHKLLEYCLNPTQGPVEGVDVTKLLELSRASDRRPGDQPFPFDSWFEVDVCLDIINHGFRVVPQYKVAEYRIDLVVEGAKSQLAVECDGDEWHGIEQYESDVSRQRILERCGWRFWRIRGYDYYHDPINALRPLWKMLSEMGIRPFTASNVEDNVPVEDTRQEEELSEDTVQKELTSEHQSIINEEPVSETPPDDIFPTSNFAQGITAHTPQFFFSLAHNAKEMNKLQSWERQLLFNVGKYLARNWTITEKMERQTLRLLDEAKDLGLIKDDHIQAELPLEVTTALPRDFLYRVRKLEDEGWNLTDIADKFKVSVQHLQKAINQRQEEINTLIGDVFKDNDSAKSNSETISNSPSQLDVEELSAQITDIGVPKEVISKALDNFLSGLKDRQAQIIRLRFGLKDGRCHTLEEIGRNMNLSRERIRQIEAKALRKLMHPSKTKQVESLTGLLNTGVIDLLNMISPKEQKRAE